MQVTLILSSLIDSESRGVKESVHTTVAKCDKSKSPFYEDKNCDYKYVLTPERKDGKHIHGHKNTKRAFVEHWLRIVVAEEFVPEGLLSLFQ